MSTTAEKIAERFNGDGQQWEDETGVEFGAVVREHAEHVLRYNTSGAVNGAEIYKFEDGSTLIACESYWDILRRKEGVTGRASELISAAEMRGRDIDKCSIVATWIDGGDEVWALEDDGDLLNPNTGERI